eukprot:scaffold48_cov311-Pinguiococcus_pyrenoidosus.AAC.130
MDRVGAVVLAEVHRPAHGVEGRPQRQGVPNEKKQESGGRHHGILVLVLNEASPHLQRQLSPEAGDDNQQLRVEAL